MTLLSRPKEELQAGRQAWHRSDSSSVSFGVHSSSPPPDRPSRSLMVAAHSSVCIQRKRHKHTTGGGYKSHTGEYWSRRVNTMWNPGAFRVFHGGLCKVLSLVLSLSPRGERRRCCQPHPAPEHYLAEVVGVARKAVEAAGKGGRGRRKEGSRQV